MARLARLVVAGLLHVVVHRALKGQSAFLDDEDRRAYLQALQAAAREAGVAVHGYGMDECEVRLLVTPSTAAALGAMMQSLGRRYVRGFNVRHGRNGTPWEGRFRSTVVEAQDLFLSCLRFVEAGASGELAEQPHGPIDRHSSLAHHLGGAVDPLVTEHGAFWSLGNTPFEREAVYRQLLQRPVPEGLIARIRAAAMKGWALGSPEFIDGLGAVTARRLLPLKRGRPAKVSSPETVSA